MLVIFNTSPIIFLYKLNLLEKVLRLFDEIIIPKTVIDEISLKEDEIKNKVLDLEKNFSNIIFLNTKLKNFYESLRNKLGIGESEAIALSVELNADLVILDDSVARNTALNFGVKVKGTLGLIVILLNNGLLTINNFEEFYEKLKKINFRVTKHIYKKIFEEFYE